MHKLRNTKHIKALDSLYGITPNFSNEPISKKKLRKLEVVGVTRFEGTGRKKKKKTPPV